jgi:4-amino-4-deoxy-L-arabinose transferase-like glycosyltransferase
MGKGLRCMGYEKHITTHTSRLSTFDLRLSTFLILLCLVLYLPGISSLPPVDRDEARYAQATSQMLETGDFIQIRFQQDARNKKPVGIYWLQAASVALSGTLESRRIWPYRIPSVLGTIVCALLTFAIGKRLFDRRIALLGAVFLVSTPLMMVQGHLAKTDAVLLATVIAAQGALSVFYLQRGKGSPPGIGAFFTFWIAQAIGILVKGPVTPLVSMLTAGCLIAADRDASWLKSMKPLPGLALMAAIVSPWAIAIAIATKGVFYEQAVSGDMLSKVVAGTESHGFVPGYYLLLMPLTLWPASLLAGVTVWRAWKSRAIPVVRFCLAWIAPTWILFELIPTKLPHYVLPTFPALCLLIAALIYAGEDGEAPELDTKLIKAGFISCFLVLVGLGLGICVLPRVLDGQFHVIGIFCAVAALLTAAFSIRGYLQGRFLHAFTIAVVGTALLLAPAFQWVLPDINGLWLSRTVAEAARERAGGDVWLASTGYYEPSLVFLLGTRTLLTDPDDAALFLRDHPRGMAVVTGNEQGAFQKKIEELAIPARLVGTVRGFNYSKGRNMILRLYGVDPPSRAGEGRQ